MGKKLETLISDYKNASNSTIKNNSFKKIYWRFKNLIILRCSNFSGEYGLSFVELLNISKIALFKSLEVYSFKRGSLRSLLEIIMKRDFIAYFNKVGDIRRNEVRVGQNIIEEIEDDNILEIDNLLDTQKALSEIENKNTREVIYEKFVLGKTYKDIAKSRDVSSSAICQKCNIELKRIRRKWED